jgi:hypothetical protein
VFPFLIPLNEETDSIELTIASVSFLFRSLNEQNYLNFIRSLNEMVQNTRLNLKYSFHGKLGIWINGVNKS